MILVTGATGFVGCEIVRRLRANGYPVRAIVRQPDRARWLEREFGVELFQGDVLNPNSLSGSMKDVRCTIHLVGVIRERGKLTFENVHVNGTRNVIDAAKRGGVNRFIHMSALGTRADGRSRYHKTKWQAEESVRASGLDWTIFRPSVIFGPRDEFVNELAKVIRAPLPFVPVIGTGRTRLQPVAVEDVAHCFVEAIKNDASIEKEFALVGAKAYPMDDLMRVIMRALGKRKPLLHLPLPIARIQAFFFEKLLARPPFTRDQLIMLQEDNVGDPAPAAAMFAFTPQNFETGIAKYLK